MLVVLTFFKDSQVHKRQIIAVDYRIISAACVSTYKNLRLNATHIIGIITDNFGKTRVSYLVKLFDGKPGLVIISLIPKAIAMTEIFELPTYKACKGETKRTSSLGFLAHAASKKINVLHPFVNASRFKPVYLSPRDSITDIIKPNGWSSPASFSELDVAW